jgi:hypothetical protein
MLTLFYLCANSASLLYRLCAALEAVQIDRGDQARGNLLRLALPINGCKQASLLVVGGQRCGLLFIHREAFQDNCGCIVGALKELTLAGRTVRERVACGDGVRSIAGATFTAARHPAYNLAVVKHWLHDDCERAAQLAKHAIKCGGLCGSTGKAIEEKAVVAGEYFESASYQRDNHVVANQLSTLDRCFRLEAQWCFCRNLSPENIAG